LLILALDFCCGIIVVCINSIDPVLTSLPASCLERKIYYDWLYGLIEGDTVILILVFFVFDRTSEIGNTNFSLKLRH